MLEPVIYNRLFSVVKKQVRLSGQQHRFHKPRTIHAIKLVTGVAENAICTNNSASKYSDLRYEIYIQYGQLEPNTEIPDDIIILLIMTITIYPEGLKPPFYDTDDGLREYFAYCWEHHVQRRT